MTADVSTPITFVKPKVVEAAFSLPLVTDTYTYLAATSAPLQPYMDMTVTAVSPVVESSYATFKTTMAPHAEKVPEVVMAKMAAATEQVAACCAAADSSLCSGLEQLVAAVPALKEATPALYASTLAAATAHATLLATYLASFTLAQVVLKASDAGLETTDALLKLVPGEKVVPIMEGIKRVRAEAAVVRKEGARKNGTEQVAALEDATLVEAVTAILGITWILAMFGITVATTEAKVETATTEAKVETTKVEVAKVETAKVEVAKVEVAHVEVAKVETAKVEVAKVEALKETKAPATKEDKKAKK